MSAGGHDQTSRAFKAGLPGGLGERAVAPDVGMPGRNVPALSTSDTLARARAPAGPAILFGGPSSMFGARETVRRTRVAPRDRATTTAEQGVGQAGRSDSTPSDDVWGDQRPVYVLTAHIVDAGGERTCRMDPAARRSRLGDWLNDLESRGRMAMEAIHPGLSPNEYHLLTIVNDTDSHNDEPSSWHAGRPPWFTERHSPGRLYSLMREDRVEELFIISIYGLGCNTRGLATMLERSNATLHFGVTRIETGARSRLTLDSQDLRAALLDTRASPAAHALANQLRHRSTGRFTLWQAGRLERPGYLIDSRAFGALRRDRRSV